MSDEGYVCFGCEEYVDGSPESREVDEKGIERPICYRCTWIHRAKKALRQAITLCEGLKRCPGVTCVEHQQAIDTYLENYGDLRG